MRFNIRVPDYRVLILKSDTSVHQQLTGLAGSEGNVALPAFRDVLTFQQVVKVAIRTPDYTDLLAAVRFYTKKGNAIVKREFITKGLAEELIFKADDVVDLARYRDGTDMCGKWTFEAYIAFFRPSRLKLMNKRSRDSAIASLPNYTLIGDTWFTIVERSRVDEDEYLPTGELRRPREIRPQDMEQVVDVNNI